jgi:hypothetical protein
MDIYLFFKNTWLITVLVKEFLQIKQSKSQKPLPSKSPKGEEGREGGGDLIQQFLLHVTLVYRLFINPFRREDADSFLPRMSP